TAIGDGLSLAVGHLRNSKAKSRVIVLLTDGDNNVGQVDPGTAGELAAGYGIRTYTIAIGREGKVRMPIRQQGPFGNAITTYQWFDNALNPELLEAIAKVTGGRFYRVTDEDALLSVFREIDRLEKSEIKSTEKVRYEENFQKPLKLGLLLLLLEQVLARGWWRLLP
ncbi:MAG: VWA domain-containing protein, partial [Oligoflexia bacterium]|nr:VWA domain-containing protein [Oligoflexia bacterium]